MFNIGTFLACQQLINTQARLVRERENRLREEVSQNKEDLKSNSDAEPEKLETCDLDDNSLVSVYYHRTPTLEEFKEDENG